MVGATTVDGMQPGREGGGSGDSGRCDLRLYKRLVSTQKQHVGLCGPKEIKKNISVFHLSNLIGLSFMFRPLDIIYTSCYDQVTSLTTRQFKYNWDSPELFSTSI